MAGVLKMIQRVASGSKPVLPAPANLHVTAVTNSTVALAWDAVTGAAGGYQVLRNGASAGAPASDITFTDTGLDSGTQYTYTVAALAADKTTRGQLSAPVNATTSGKPPPPPPIQPPTGLAVTSTTNTSISLKWDAEADAASYKVYTDGSATGAPAATPSFTSSGLQPETTHSYTVTGVDAQGAESKQSAPVTGKTASSWQCKVFTSSNYAHVQAGRAHDKIGHAYSNGGEQDMGLDNTFYRTTLAETKDSYYIIGQCP
jgi:poly(3-hydroxybutyrate) depolymerase